MEKLKRKKYKSEINFYVYKDYRQQTLPSRKSSIDKHMHADNAETTGQIIKKNTYPSAYLSNMP
jgi:hypothetical protein